MTTNTLTSLLPDAYAALDVVSREIVGLIPAVTLDARANEVAKNQTLRVPVAPTSNATFDITPAMAVPAESDAIFTNAEITISNFKGVPFSWDGEEQFGMNKGPGYLGLRAGQIAQAMRTLVNLIETDLAGAHTKFSRAAGAVGTAPFASTLAAATAARKILIDNGAPIMDSSLVLNTTAGADLRTLMNVQTGRGAIDVSMGEQGILTRANELAVRESAAIKNSTAGTGSGITIATGGYAVGAVTFAMKNATGTGTFAAGDVITIAGDTNQYVVTSVTQAGANPATGDTFTIAAPGLRQAISGEKIVTIIAASSRHMAFSRSAIVLATRLPKIPQEGDMRLASEVIVDPRSGLAFEISVWPGQRKVRYEIAIAWGYKVIKPEHTALLIGPVGA